MHNSLPSFSAALCFDPVGIDNGLEAFTGNSVGDTATYTCNSGFELIGNVTTTCTQVDANSAVFQPAPPFCRREYSNRRLSVVVTVACVNRTSTVLTFLSNNWLCIDLVLYSTVF